jgi:5-(carboxyamino)imidazole ribonucleotide mutase
VGTLGVGTSGATNAALLAAAVIGVEDPAMRDAIRAYRARRAEAITEDVDPSELVPVGDKR